MRNGMKTQNINAAFIAFFFGFWIFGNKSEIFIFLKETSKKICVIFDYEKGEMESVNCYALTRLVTVWNGQMVIFEVIVQQF